MVLLLAACASDAPEQAQVAVVPPTAVPTTAPLSAPTATPFPAPTSTALPAATSTPVPPPAATPTLAPAVTPTQEATAASPTTTTADAAPAPTELPTATVAAEVVETPTAVPTSTPEVPATEEAPEPEPTPTLVPVTPTVVAVVSGEPPLECYDQTVKVYLGFVDGVDALSFEGGRVYCSGAGTNAVSAAASYRHSSGLVIQRNADYIFNEGGTAYIPYSGTVHFCLEGQPASAPIRAETVPALLVIIDSEAQRQLAQGATAPAGFTGGGSQC